MPEEERMVATREIEKIKKYIDDIITSKSIPFSSFNQIPLRGNEMDLEEKDKVVWYHIKENPGIIKEQIAKAFEDRPGYSRKPVFNVLKRLNNNGWIVGRPDRTNSRIHHLFINNENEFVLLIHDVDSFKEAYFILIDNLDSFLKNNDVVFTGFGGLKENLKLVNAILTPFKFILSLHIVFDLFLPHENLVDGELLHRRFALIYSTIKEMQTKLYESFFKEPRIKLVDEFFINTHLYDNLGFLNNILHSTLWGLNYTNIEDMLITLDKYGLIENAKIVMDYLWKIIYPIFPIMYPHYNKAKPDVFKDWRKVIAKFREFDITAQVQEYRKGLPEFSPSLG